MTSFVSDATELSVFQINLIGELKNDVQKGNARERTPATMTLLKLCESGFDITNEPDTNSCFISYNHPPSSAQYQPVGRLRRSAATQGLRTARCIRVGHLFEIQ